MCGIAGLIHRGKSSNVGSELQGMLQALKHRGEDSTGYALYGDTDGKNFIMRFKVGENVGEGSSSIMEDVSVYDERKKIVDQYLAEMGAKVLKEERTLPYSLRYEISYDKKDLLDFSQKIESIPGVEILSMGKSLEVIKDLGNAKAVCDRYSLDMFQTLPFLGCFCHRFGTGPLGKYRYCSTFSILFYQNKTKYGRRTGFSIFLPLRSMDDTINGVYHGI